MPPLKNRVLGEEHAMDAAHKAGALAVEIRKDLLSKGWFVEVAGSNGDAEGHALFSRR